MHFSHEECDCRTVLICIGLQVQKVRKSDPEMGRNIQVAGKDIFIWIHGKRSATIFESCCTIGSSLPFPICGVVILSQIHAFTVCLINKKCVLAFTE